MLIGHWTIRRRLLSVTFVGLNDNRIHHHTVDVGVPVLNSAGLDWMRRIGDARADCGVLRIRRGRRCWALRGLDCTTWRVVEEWGRFGRPTQIAVSPMEKTESGSRISLWCDVLVQGWELDGVATNNYKGSLLIRGVVRRWTSGLRNVGCRRLDRLLRPGQDMSAPMSALRAKSRLT